MPFTRTKKEENVSIKEDSEITEWVWIGKEKGTEQKREYSFMKSDFE